MNQTSELVVTKQILADLFAELKSYTNDNNSSDDLYPFDAFRYEMFARRLVAAEYGRPDAVEWALNWHADLQAEMAAKAAAELARHEITRINNDKSRADLLSGKCGNPLYQAFLDTKEDPENWISNVEYFVFHSNLSAEYEKYGQSMSFKEYVRCYADRNLSERVKAERKIH